MESSTAGHIARRAQVERDVATISHRTRQSATTKHAWRKSVQSDAGDALAQPTHVSSVPAGASRRRGGWIATAMTALAIGVGVGVWMGGTEEWRSAVAFATDADTRTSRANPRLLMDQNVERFGRRVSAQDRGKPRASQPAIPSARTGPATEIAGADGS